MDKYTDFFSGQANRKPVPESIPTFGATDHIGGPLAAVLTREAPSIRLRLATHSDDKTPTLSGATFMEGATMETAS